MSAESKAPSLTEAERIEFNRRIDIASAVVPVARERLEKKRELADSLSSAIKKANSLWYWVALATSAAINYLIPGNGFYSGIGFWLCIAVGVSWFTAISDVESLRAELSGCKQQLDSLCLTWTSAVGGEEGFWNIGSMDINDGVYRDWWFRWNESILMRVRMEK